MVRCFVQVAADPDPPRGRDYEFLAVPRIGEWISLGTDVQYRVIDIDHVPGGVETIDEWVNPPSITITIKSAKSS